MSVYKPFTTSDIITSPFEVNKSFTFKGAASVTGSGIDRLLGKNITSSLWVSGSNPTGQVSTQDKFLVYRSIRELYYSNFLEGEDGSPVGTASFNEDGTITGPAYTPNYYNYLPNTLDANRFFSTGSDAEVGVIAIPSNIFGENIKPGTFRYEYSGSMTSGIITDDGEGNLFTSNIKVGDIIYQHGMVLITSYNPVGTGSLYGTALYGTGTYAASNSESLNEVLTSDNVTCSFQSSLTLYEKQYKCNIRENEYNYSQNPTIISGSSNSGVLNDFTTGSYFSPYATTVGLYNNDKELLAIAKLSQPLPLSTTTDINIIINLDL